MPTSGVAEGRNSGNINLANSPLNTLQPATNMLVRPLSGFIVLIAVAALLIQPIQTRAADSPILSGTISSVLKNGLKVIVREQHGAPLVAIDLWVRAGSGQEGQKESGVAHFIEHLIFKGTPSRKPGEIDASFEDLGASLGAGTTRDGAHFFATVPSQYLGHALEVLSDALQHATFDSSEMEKERAVILDELARGRNDWRKEMADTLRGALYPSSPFGRPILGEPASIKEISRDRVLAFFRRYYSPNNASIVLVGDVSQNEALQAVDKAFGSWEKGIPQVNTLPAASPQKVEHAADGEFAACGITFPGPDGADAPAVCAADILSVILGDPQRGRLSPALKGLCAAGNSGADFATLSRQTTFNLYSRPISPSQIEAVRQRMEAEVQKLRGSPVSEEELDYAKRRLLGGYLFDIETYAGQARMLGITEMASGYSAALSYFDNVRKIRPKDLQSFAQIYLVTVREAVAIIKPKEVN